MGLILFWDVKIMGIETLTVKGSCLMVFFWRRDSTSMRGVGEGGVGMKGRVTRRSPNSIM